MGAEPAADADAEADPWLAYGYHGYGHGLYRPYGYRSYWGGYPYGGYRYDAYGYYVKILISAQILPKCVQRVNLSILNLIYQRVLKPKKSLKIKHFFGKKKKKKKKKKS